MLKNESTLYSKCQLSYSQPKPVCDHPLVSTRKQYHIKKKECNFTPDFRGHLQTDISSRFLHDYSSTSADTGPGGVMVERSLGVQKVAGSIPSHDIPKVVKRWYKQLPCLRSALTGECLEIWLVGSVSAYNVTGWGDPVKYLRQDRSSMAAL